MSNQRGYVILQLAAATFLAGAIQAVDTTAPQPLRYAIAAGQTNAYTLTITQQGESGRETMTGTLVVSSRKESEGLALSFRGQLRPKMTPGIPYMSMGFRPGMPVTLNSYFTSTYGPPADAREIVIDPTGQVLRLAGDLALPLPLGSLLTSFLMPLPSGAAVSWEKEEVVFLLDEPLLAGPAVVFQQQGPMVYYPGRAAQAALAARQKTSVKVVESIDQSVTLQAQSEVESLWRTGNEPRLSGSTQTKLVLDRVAGWPRRVEMESKSAATTEQLSRRNLLTLKWELLEGAEREAALNPPTPRPLELTGAELDKLKTKLDSDDLITRQMAARELTMGGRKLQPDAELLTWAERLAGDNDEVVRHAGLTLLANYGTRETVPLLARALKEINDASVRTALIKGLGRLQDSASRPSARRLPGGRAV